MKTVYLGLGSNVGDREAMLQAALDELHSREVSVRRVSSVYETEPMDLPGQRWFLNLVAEVQTALFPLQLLTRIGKIEQHLGRRRLVAKGPRSIDIDILLYGNFVVRTPNLVIPHERLGERRFVLVPLLELAPDLRDPGSRRPLRDLLGATAGQAVRKMDFRPVVPPC
jgi:2-amino-4-hydroxy-6-hydroxymethyldihydropteridine diphosphokinase